MKHVHSSQERHQDNVTDIVLLDSLIPHLILYSSVFIINFEQVNVCLKPVSWHYIYTQVERDHHSAMVIVNFENMTPCSSVSIVDSKHVFIFWV